MKWALSGPRPGLLDAQATVQAMKELHKVNDYKVGCARCVSMCGAGLVWYACVLRSLCLCGAGAAAD